MILEKKEKNVIEIDLTGPDGNVFVLLGYAKRLAKWIGIDGTEICNEMMSGDYENAVAVFEKNFGDHVILYR